MTPSDRPARSGAAGGVQRVREAVPGDAAAWERMRTALWPDADAGEHAEEIARYFAGDFPRGPWLALVAEAEDGAVVGFAEVATRPYAEGCTTSPVAYLEGWWVDTTYRKHGVGAALIAAAEQWGPAQGCAEFASDAEVDNDVSRSAHEACGFEDVGLVRCFRKSLRREV